MLSFENISKTFNRNTEAVLDLYQGLNLEVEEGEFVTIIGSNGSGKSTLFNLISGQITQDEGKVCFEGKDLANTKVHHRFKEISRVYQDPVAGTSPSLTILENLSLAYDKGNLLNLKKGVRRDKIEHFKELLKELDLGLEDKLDAKVGQLSGGQRQALSLLMALMNEPKVLLLDEHTAALDPKSSEIIMQLTKKMVEQRQITTLMVTHNLQHALDYGTRLIMFHKGKIIFDVKGTDKKQLTRDDLVSLFMEHDDFFTEMI